MDPVTVYQTGLIAVALFSLLWSFVLDSNKPPTVREFFAKLAARFLFLALIFTVLISFVYLAIGVLTGGPQARVATE